MKRILTFATILILVVSVVGPPAMAQSSDSGLVGVPDSNIHEDLPEQAQFGLDRSALTGSVMASDHAETLQVTVTTRSRAAEHAPITPPGQARGGPPAEERLALIFGDNSSHEGRTVALPRTALEEELGYVPEAAWGVHESGDRWTRTISEEDDLVTFEIPKFSDNVVTFSGTVNISSPGAQDGATITYNLSDLDGATDPVLTLTGKKNTEQIDLSGTYGDGDSMSLSVGGTEPVDLNMTLTGKDTTLSNHTGQGAMLHDSEVTTSTTKTIYTTQETETVDVWIDYYVKVDSYNGASGTADVDVGVYDSSADSTSWTNIESAYQSDINSGSETNDDTYETTYSLDAGDEIITKSNVDLGTNNEGWAYHSDTYVNKTVESGNISGTFAGSSYSSPHLSPGEEWSTTETVSPESAYDISTNSDTGGAVNLSVTGTEETLTQDAGVGLNDQEWGNVSGTLADGETRSFTLNSSALQEGTNTVDVVLPSLSSDAPAPQVAFELTHEASSEISTEYAANGWEESYNTSKTFTSTQESPTLEIPFSSTVYRIDYLERSVDGGTWQTVDSGNYNLDDSDLTVQLDDGDGDGDVDADSEIAVRVAAHKMDVENGQVTVTDPVEPGDPDLDVGVRIDQRSDGFQIGVGGTKNGNLVHYPYQESWDNPAGVAVQEADGGQYLEFPNAPEGGSLRVKTVPLEIAPETGDAGVIIQDPDEPTFKITPGSSSGDDLTIYYHGTTSGETYELYSTSQSRVVGTDTAESPAIFEQDDSEETFLIRLQESTETIIDGGGNWPQPTPETPLSRYLIVAGWAFLVVAMAYGTGRSSMDSRTRWGLLGITTVGGGLLTLELLNPGSVSERLGQAIGSSLEEILPLAGLAAIGIVVFSIWSWWQKRQTEAATPETEVAFNLESDD